MGYRVVYIDNTMDFVNNEKAWKMLSDVLRLRLIGYRKEYGEIVLPLGKDDFFSTQILIYKSEQLLCTYKFTRRDLCDTYGVQFPILPELEEKRAPEYSRVIRSILTSAKNKGHSLSYCGGWTIHPDARNERKVAATLRDLTIATHYDYKRRFGIEESIIAGVIRFKTHLHQEEMGYKRLKLNGRELEPVGLTYLGLEKVYVLHMTQHSESARRIYEKYRKVLDAAEVFSRNLATPAKRAA